MSARTSKTTKTISSEPQPRARLMRISVSGAPFDLWMQSGATVLIGVSIGRYRNLQLSSMRLIMVVVIGCELIVFGHPYIPQSAEVPFQTRQHVQLLPPVIKLSVSVRPNLFNDDLETKCFFF